MHAEEGPDDMPAHIRAMLTGVSLSVPVQQGAVMVGVWQGIFLVEHRDRPHMREIILHLTGMVSDAEVWRQNTVRRPVRMPVSATHLRIGGVRSINPCPRVWTRTLPSA